MARMFAFIGNRADLGAQVLALHAPTLTIATQPGEPVFDFSSNAGLLFFADRPSATRYFQILYASAPGSQREVVAELEQRQVRLAITSPVVMDGVPTAQRYPIVADYLDQNFAPWRRIGHITFLKRR